MGSYVVSDNRVVTGQNPASAVETMVAFIGALRAMGF